MSGRRAALAADAAGGCLTPQRGRRSPLPSAAPAAPDGASVSRRYGRRPGGPAGRGPRGCPSRPEVPYE